MVFIALTNIERPYQIPMAPSVSSIDTKGHRRGRQKISVFAPLALPLATELICSVNATVGDFTKTQINDSRLPMWNEDK